VDLKHALRLARQKVLALWPELASVEPRVAARSKRQPTARLLSKLEVPAAVRATSSEAEEVTFTFAGKLCTPEGDTIPRVARVTVRDGRGVVRATISR